MRLSCGQNRLIGRSGEAQTRGLRIPNAARYQLRYTPIVIKLWSCKWSNLWSNTFLTAIFCFPYHPKIARLKGFRRLAPINVRNAVYAPKCRALPVEPHPDIHFSAMIPRRGVKIKIFLSVVIPVVKAAFVPFSATGGKPAIARVVRPSGLLSKPRMDRVYALPNQARYQLRYTRIKICRPHPGGISTIPAFFLACKGKICLGAFCIPGAFPPPPDYSPRAAFRASTRSVFSQATPRSSRPIWP